MRKISYSLNQLNIIISSRLKFSCNKETPAVNMYVNENQISILFNKREYNICNEFFFIKSLLKNYVKFKLTERFMKSQFYIFIKETS